MNVENARKWMKDLRSGKYKQTKAALHKISGGESSYCCLGRVCELAGITGVVPNRYIIDKERRVNFYQYDGEEVYLPEAAQNWLGIQGQDPILWIPPRLRTKLRNVPGGGSLKAASAAMLNDKYNLTFEQIADCISYTLRYHSDGD